MSCVWHWQTAAADLLLLLLLLLLLHQLHFRLQSTTNFTLTQPLTYIRTATTRTVRLALIDPPIYRLFTVLGVHIQAVAFLQYPLTRGGDRRLQRVCHRAGLSARHCPTSSSHQPRPAAALLFPPAAGEDFQCCTRTLPVSGRADDERPPAARQWRHTRDRHAAQTCFLKCCILWNVFFKLMKCFGNCCVLCIFVVFSEMLCFVYFFVFCEMLFF